MNDYHSCKQGHILTVRKVSKFKIPCQCSYYFSHRITGKRGVVAVCLPRVMKVIGATGQGESRVAFPPDTGHADNILYFIQPLASIGTISCRTSCGLRLSVIFGPASRLTTLRLVSLLVFVLHCHHVRPYCLSDLEPRYTSSVFAAFHCISTGGFSLHLHS